MEKKILRLTESELKQIIENSVKRILKEDVLGNNFHEADEEDGNNVRNNYEPFDEQNDELPFGEDDDNSPLLDNKFDWSVVGEEPFDPTEWNQDEYINHEFENDALYAGRE